MMNHATILKLKEPGLAQIFRFRVKPFEEIRLHFHVNKGLDGKFPVVDISSTGVKFGRQIAEGVIDYRMFRQQNIEPHVEHDFVVYTNFTQLQIGVLEKSQVLVLGTYDYTDLDSLAYVGFSSTNNAAWILENGLPGDNIFIDGSYQRRLEVVCEVEPEDNSFQWKLRGPREVSSVACVPAHTCHLSNVTHDHTVGLAGLRDHLGQHLFVIDGVKLGGSILAWCIDTGPPPTLS